MIFEILLVAALVIGNGKSEAVSQCPHSIVTVPAQLDMDAQLGQRAIYDGHLQIFRNLQMECTGRVTKWLLYQHSKMIAGLHLAVFRERSPYIFEMVDDARINKIRIPENAKDDWHFYPLNQPFAVRKGDYLGIYYDNYLNDNELPVGSHEISSPPVDYPATYVLPMSASDGLRIGGVVNVTTARQVYRIPSLGVIIAERHYTRFEQYRMQENQTSAYLNNSEFHLSINNVSATGKVDDSRRVNAFTLTVPKADEQMSKPEQRIPSTPVKFELTTAGTFRYFTTKEAATVVTMSPTKITQSETSSQSNSSPTLTTGTKGITTPTIVTTSASTVSKTVLPSSTILTSSTPSSTVLTLERSTARTIQVNTDISSASTSKETSTAGSKATTGSLASSTATTTIAAKTKSATSESATSKATVAIDTATTSFSSAAATITTRWTRKGTRRYRTKPPTTVEAASTQWTTKRPSTAAEQRTTTESSQSQTTIVSSISISQSTQRTGTHSETTTIYIPSTPKRVFSSSLSTAESLTPSIATATHTIGTKAPSSPLPTTTIAASTSGANGKTSPSNISPSVATSTMSAAVTRVSRAGTRRMRSRKSPQNGVTTESVTLPSATISTTSKVLPITSSSVGTTQSSTIVPSQWPSSTTQGQTSAFSTQTRGVPASGIPSSTRLSDAFVTATNQRRTRRPRRTTTVIDSTPSTTTNEGTSADTTSSFKTNKPLGVAGQRAMAETSSIRLTTSSSAPSTSTAATKATRRRRPVKPTVTTPTETVISTLVVEPVTSRTRTSAEVSHFGSTERTASNMGGSDATTARTQQTTTLLAENFSTMSPISPKQGTRRFRTRTASVTAVTETAFVPVSTNTPEMVTNKMETSTTFGQKTVKEAAMLSTQSTREFNTKSISATEVKTTTPVSQAVGGLANTSETSNRLVTFTTDRSEKSTGAPSTKGSTTVTTTQADTSKTAQTISIAASSARPESVSTAATSTILSPSTTGFRSFGTVKPFNPTNATKSNVNEIKSTTILHILNVTEPSPVTIRTRPSTLPDVVIPVGSTVNNIAVTSGTRPSTLPDVVIPAESTTKNNRFSSVQQTKFFSVFQPSTQKIVTAPLVPSSVSASYFMNEPVTLKVVLQQQGNRSALQLASLASSKTEEELTPDTSDRTSESSYATGYFTTGLAHTGTSSLSTKKQVESEFSRAATSSQFGQASSSSSSQMSSATFFAWTTNAGANRQPSGTVSSSTTVASQTSKKGLWSPQRITFLSFGELGSIPQLFAPPAGTQRRGMIPARCLVEPPSYDSCLQKVRRIHFIYELATCREDYGCPSRENNFSSRIQCVAFCGSLLI